jgi:hypothetical protein
MTLRIWRLLDWHARSGMLMPTHREIAAAMHISKSSAERHLKKLELHDILFRQRFRARTITMRREYPYDSGGVGEAKPVRSGGKSR